jgi:hypothetical protein
MCVMDTRRPSTNQIEQYVTTAAASLFLPQPTDEHLFNVAGVRWRFGFGGPNKSLPSRIYLLLRCLIFHNYAHTMTGQPGAVLKYFFPCTFENLHVSLQAHPSGGQLTGMQSVGLYHRRPATVPLQIVTSRPGFGGAPGGTRHLLRVGSWTVGRQSLLGSERLVVSLVQPRIRQLVRQRLLEQGRG